MYYASLIFIHVLAAAVALGSLAFCVLLLLPALETPSDVEIEKSARYKTLSLLAPTVFACLLALIVSGMMYLSDAYTEQVNLRSGYYNLFGAKMFVVAGAFFLSLYQTFNLRGKILNLDLRPENREGLPAALDKMASVGRLILGLIAVAIFLGVWLARF